MRLPRSPLSSLLFVSALLSLLSSILFVPAPAAPLSQTQSIDFFRDVSSPKLDGLATRSDGRLVSGPRVLPLTGAPVPDLLWSLAPASPANTRWHVGTGPAGQILDVTFDWDARTYTTTHFATVADAQVFALAPLPDGRLLAGTSPRGTLSLLAADGTVTAALRLPADSILDLLALPAGDVLVATGNPGRIYRVDTAALAVAGVATTDIATPEELAAAGLTEFGRIRDRNVRRLALAPDGSLYAGSSPAGRIYVFPASGGDPVIRHEHAEAEVTDLAFTPAGDLFATLIIDPTSTRTRIVRPTPQPPPPTNADASSPTPPNTDTPVLPDTPPRPAFTGRSALVHLPAADGLPETVAARGNLAFYRLAPHADTFLLVGGDEGELLGYDPTRRRTLTYAAAPSAQVLEARALAPGRFLLLQNNLPGFSLLDFAAPGPRIAETRRLDLRTPSTLGALRLDRLRGLAPADLTVEVRANVSADQREGWTPWTPAPYSDGGYLPALPVRGRYVQIRLALSEAAPADLELDNGTLHHLPQNRRPRLSAFRILSPNFALVARREANSPTNLTLGSIIDPSRGDENAERRAATALLGSPVVAQPAAQLVHWSVEDLDGDNLVVTFSVRHEADATWQDLTVDTTDGFAQFDRRLLRAGHHFTRLTVREIAPRLAAERHAVTFETDNLLIDHTPPVIEEATLTRTAAAWLLTVRARDAHSGLQGIAVTLNNGHAFTVAQPVDGVLDQLAETFAAEIPHARAAGATALEILLYDAQGNHTPHRLLFP